MADTALQRQPMDPMDLLQLAIAKEGSVDVIERLAALQIQFQERADRQEFAEAFMKFKQSAPKVLKTKFVDYPNSKGGRTQYWHVEADKAADILGPALLAVGLTYSWKTEDLPDGRVRCTCILRHRNGYEAEGAKLSGPCDTSGGKNPIQGVGSATSYLERYTLLSTCGITPEGHDDDGNQEPTLEDFKDRLIAIQQAPDEEELKRVYIDSIKAARNGYDKVAADMFSTAKELRLLDLRGQ